MRKRNGTFLSNWFNRGWLIFDLLVRLLGEGVKTRVRRLTRRQKEVGIIALILVVFISSEVYAHNYVQVRALSIVTEEQALKQLGVWLNGTYTFSSSGCSWLLAWRINRPQPPMSFAYFLIYKTGQNSSLWIPRTDLAILKPNPTSNNSGYFEVWATNTAYESSNTTIAINYILGWEGTYKIDFDIRVQVYQETLLGLVPREVINLPSNFTMYYGPWNKSDPSIYCMIRIRQDLLLVARETCTQ